MESRITEFGSFFNLLYDNPTQTWVISKQIYIRDLVDGDSIQNWLTTYSLVSLVRKETGTTNLKP